MTEPVNAAAAASGPVGVASDTASAAESVVAASSSVPEAAAIATDGLEGDELNPKALSTPGKKRLARRRLVFDVVVLAGYLLSANPAITGIPVHEWVGLGAFVLLAAHCAARGMWRGTGGKGLGLTVLNVLVLLCAALCVVSGVMVSGTVLPALGLFADGYYFWDPLHAVAAKMLLALLLVHVAVHIPWIAGAFKK